MSITYLPREPKYTLKFQADFSIAFDTLKLLERLFELRTDSVELFFNLLDRGVKFFELDCRNRSADWTGYLVVCLNPSKSLWDFMATSLTGNSDAFVVNV